MHPLPAWITWLIILSLAAGMVPTRTAAAGNAYQKLDLALPVGAGKVCADGVEALEQGRFAEAEASFRKVLDLLKKHGDPHPFETALVTHWLGHALVEQHRYVESEAVLRQALAGLQAEAKKPSAAAARAGLAHTEAITTVQLGLSIYGQHRYAEAEVFLVRSVQRLERLPTADASSLERACFFLGDSLTRLGRPAEGERWQRRALEHCEGISPGPCPNFGGNLWALGKALAAQRKYDEAERCFRQALALAEKDLPDRASADSEPFNLVAALGQVLLEQGRAREAQPLLERVVSLLSKKGLEKEIHLQNAVRDLARCWQAQGRNTEAGELQRRHGIDPATGLAAGEIPDHPFRAYAVKVQAERLAKALPARVLDEVEEGLKAFGAGQFPKAEKILRGVLPKVQRSSRIPPHAVALVQVTLGDSLIEQRRYAKAEPFLRSAQQALEGLLRTPGQEPDLGDRVYLCRTHLRLGLALYGQNRRPEAIATLVRGLNLADEIGLDDLAIAASRMYLGDDLFAEGKYLQAEDQYRRAVETCSLYQAPEDLHVYLSSRVGVARSVFERGRYAEAIPLLEAVIPLAERSTSLRPQPGLTLTLTWSLGTSLRRAGRPAEAEDVFRRNLSKVEQAFGPRSNETASYELSLGMSLKDLKRPADAEVHLRQATQIWRALAPHDPDTAEAILLHAELLDELAKPQEAVRAYQEAVAILERPAINAPETLARALKGLREALRHAGRAAEAETIDQKLRRLDQRNQPTAE